ncbi:MAG: Lipoprotein-releasing system transrane protein LolC [Verrucomicrobiota bacterium]|jgi:lipoprotein-releasing system permease protein
MPWFLYLALRQLFPTGRRFPFFTFMSALGVGVGVLLLVVSTSIMGGFGQGIRRMIVDTQGEIQIMAVGGAIADGEPLLRLIGQQSGVAAATPYAQGHIGLFFENKPVFPLIQGVDLNRVNAVVPFHRYLVAGKFEDLDDDSIILSVQLAQSLGVRMNDTVDVVSPLLYQRLQSDEIFLPRSLRVVGIFQIGHQHLDKSLAIGSLRLVQELYGLGSAVHGISVRLAPGADELKIASALNTTLPPDRRALTWFESNADFQNIIRFEKYMIFFLLTFIVIVAALSIMSSLTISVVRKTREIGLLGALGSRSRDVAICFCAQGFFLGVIGTAAGLGMAWVVLTFRNDIVRILARATVNEEVFQQFYGFVELPSHTSGAEVLIIIIGSVVSATFAGLLPALRAARLKPVEALRSE